MGKDLSCSDIQVLKYHRLAEQKPGDHAPLQLVWVEDFIWQMKLLEKLNFTTITFSDYQLYLDDRLTLPAKPIVITFDSADPVTSELALSVMQPHNMRGVFFMDFMSEEMRTVKNEAGKRSSEMGALKDLLVNTRETGFEIGVHGSRKRTEGMAVRDLRKQLTRMKNELEDRVKQPVQSFSCPDGDSVEDLYPLIANTGYKFICGDFSVTEKNGDGLHCIRRLSVNRNTGRSGFFIRLVSPTRYREFNHHKFRDNRSDGFFSDPYDHIRKIFYEKKYSK